jgi:CRP/FNR family cyclic AMP-dependent transcriptional regulator
MFKQILSRWFGPPAKPASVPDDSGYFATQFADRHEDTQLFVPWANRAPDLKARPYDNSLGVLSLVKLLSQDQALGKLGAEQLAILGGYLDYVQLDNGKQVIGQDEQGDFLLIVLQGSVAEERRLHNKSQVRIGEARPGDLLGEMSLFDGGGRFSSCVALSPVTLAVLSSVALERMMQEEPRLAGTVLAWIAKRLSLRLRQVSARLSVQLTRTTAD